MKQVEKKLKMLLISKNRGDLMGETCLEIALMPLTTIQEMDTDQGFQKILIAQGAVNLWGVNIEGAKNLPEVVIQCSGFS